MRVVESSAYSLHLRVDGQGLRRGDHQLRHLAWRKSGGDVRAPVRNGFLLVGHVGSLGRDPSGG